MLLMSAQLHSLWVAIHLSVRLAVVSLNTTIQTQSMEFGIQDPMNELVCKRR
jgi:hypothetical protein